MKYIFLITLFIFSVNICYAQTITDTADSLEKTDSLDIIQSDTFLENADSLKVKVIGSLDSANVNSYD